MTRLRLSDLPPEARRQVEQRLGVSEGAPKAKKRGAPTANTNVTCVACGVACTSEPAMFRHMTKTGHGRYEITLPDDSRPEAGR